MFIEDLWEKHPEQTINAIKKIFDVREERGDNLKFVCIGNGALRFEKYGHCSFGILLTDFQAYGQDVNSRYNIAWLKFMTSVYGKKYVSAFISHRNNVLDRYMAEYEENYNQQTNNILDELGVRVQDTHNKIK